MRYLTGLPPSDRFYSQRGLEELESTVVEELKKVGDKVDDQGERTRDRIDDQADCTRGEVKRAFVPLKTRSCTTRK